MNESVRPDLGPARDFFGYGPTPPHPHWPGDARIAINFNLNFEAGGERSLLEGDNQTEDMLNDIGFPAYYGVRSPIVESVFEYGPRVGVWRLLRIFKEFDVKVSVLGVVRGMQQCPEAVSAFLADGHEIRLDHIVHECLEARLVAPAEPLPRLAGGPHPVGPAQSARQLLRDVSDRLW